MAYEIMRRERGAMSTKIQSSLRWKKGGRIERVIESKCTFDVASLSERAFVGYECKVSLTGFLKKHSGSRFGKRTINKLRFMTDTNEWLEANGRSADVCLVSLDSELRASFFKRALTREGYECIDIVAGDEVGKALVG